MRETPSRCGRVGRPGGGGGGGVVCVVVCVRLESYALLVPAR